MRILPVLALALAALAMPTTAQEGPAPEATPASPTAQELPMRSTRYYAVPPQFDYPVAALRYEIEGRCLIRFSIDAEGVPQDIQPDCDHPAFTAPVLAGMARVRMIVGEDVVPGARFLLPVSFRIPL
jgi:hypothetical protein